MAHRHETVKAAGAGAAGQYIHRLVLGLLSLKRFRIPYLGNGTAHSGQIGPPTLITIIMVPCLGSDTAHSGQALPPIQGNLL